MIKDVAETAMGAEMAGFLGYDRYPTPASDAGNRRNGSSQKRACPSPRATPNTLVGNTFSDRPGFWQSWVRWGDCVP